MVSYQSTRGSSQSNFASVLLDGLAPDGGLYSPIELPSVGKASTSEPFQATVERVVSAFVSDWITTPELQNMIEVGYKDFRDPKVCPVKQISEQQYLLDLTLGPTLAFKDFALQILAQMLDFELERRGEQALVIGATSGDTGSAAIEALKRTKNIKTVMLHPEGRVSEVQRRQMTTVDSENVLNLAVDGSFDDCQDLVKQAFVDPALRDKLNLTAVNSINWARVMVQISYYFSAHSAVATGPDNKVSFVVPTGNFGNVLAGWYAKQLGLPIDKLVVASNHNDSFPRFLESGSLVAAEVKPSHSPSMDIQISSNLERLLWEASGHDSDAVEKLLSSYRTNGKVVVPEFWLEKIRAEFQAISVEDGDTVDQIRRVYKENDLVVDPHTAVGLSAANTFADKLDTPIITLETAAPAKFPAVVKEAIGSEPALPDFMSDLFERSEHCEKLDNSYTAFSKRIQSF